MVLMTVLQVKKAFKKLTSNRRIRTYIDPENIINDRNTKYCAEKKAKKSDIKNIKNIKNTEK